MLRVIRRTLDALYFAGGMLASLFLVAILVLIVLQMAARWTGHVFPGGTDYAGYCMAASSFLALAYALNHGAHIRVSLMLTALGRWRRFGEVWCFGVAALIATYFARYAIKAAFWSYKLGDVSQGQDATPLWIPQLAMCVGTVLLALALWDHLIRIVFAGHEGIPDRPEEGGE